MCQMTKCNSCIVGQQGGSSVPCYFSSCRSWFTRTSCSTSLECLNSTIDSSTGKADLVICVFQLLVTFRRWFTFSKEEMNYIPLFDFQIIHFLYKPMFNLLYPKFYNFIKTRPITVISSEKWNGWLNYRMTWFVRVYSAATCRKKICLALFETALEQSDIIAYRISDVACSMLHWCKTPLILLICNCIHKKLFSKLRETLQNCVKLSQKLHEIFLKIERNSLKITGNSV